MPNVVSLWPNQGSTQAALIAPNSTPMSFCPSGVDTPPAHVYRQRLTLPDAPITQTFDISSTFNYEVRGPTEFLFQIHAYNGMDQHVLSESLTLTPDLPWRTFTDLAFGHRFLRVHSDAGSLSLHYQARVQRTAQALDPQAQELPIDHLPDELMHYLNPTRFCESDRLSQIAQTMFGQLPRGIDRVKAIVDWISENIYYQVGASNAMTTACDTLANRAGVCRDFAHLGITFCRAINIPARLVVGYAYFDDPPPDFHAVFEAYLGGQWVLFDPTYMSPIDNFVRIATGGDAKDVAFATIYGPAAMVFMAPLITPASIDF